MIDRENVLRSLGEVEGLWFEATGALSDRNISIKNKNIILMIEDMIRNKDFQDSPIKKLTHHNDTGYDIHGMFDLYKSIEKRPDGYWFDVCVFFSKIRGEIEYSREFILTKENNGISQEYLDRIEDIKDSVDLLVRTAEHNLIDGILFNEEGKMTHVMRLEVEENGCRND